MSTSGDVYRFVKVEDYFANYRNWQTLKTVQDCEFHDENNAISLLLKKDNGQLCCMLIQIATQNTVRFRFNPSKTTAKSYTDNNSRSVVMDSFRSLIKCINEDKKFILQWDKTPEEPVLTVLDAKKNPTMKLIISKNPFRITIKKCTNGTEYNMLETRNTLFTPNGDADHNIIQVFKKPPYAKYIGFGEQGGVNLAKNSSQINFFNYDNMRYRQIYNRGPFEVREPLYHSEPFFLLFDSQPGKDAVGGFFVDNPSQVLMDIGYLNSERTMLGTRFLDSDIYFIAGDNAKDTLQTFMSFIGYPKLKPRYALGYHQGCYGYERREDLERVAHEYRKHRIPLDGIHIDIDIQNNYQTFTIDESKFPKPKEMFSNLAKLGIKCSTNITPIISNKDSHYKTYAEGKQNGYFLKDVRTHLHEEHAYDSQDYQGGWEHHQRTVHEGNFNSGSPYIGEVYYGGGRGTTGHYADLNRKEVREWWGKQYEFLYACGLEMVWQDMTTPCIRDNRGDMKGLPFRMLISQDWFCEQKEPGTVEALKVWNLYSYNLHKATYKGLNALPGRDNKRNFIIGRGCFTGMHRFAALWTGDNSSNWDFLKINIAQILSLGMCGQAMAGQDIGGFEREHDWEQWADPELLIRWTTAGALMPWFRNHYMGKKGVKLFQEPYAYAGVDLDKWNVPHEVRHFYKCVLPVCRHYIELRYRLMQLFYDSLFENTRTGMPICRPMFLCCETIDNALYNDKLEFLNNQFFVGNDLLVAPVLDKQSAENGYGRRDIYLPSGSQWYAYMDNRAPLQPAVEGGTTLDYHAYIDDKPWHIPFILPMYVRSGAILPTLELEQYIGERHQLGHPLPLTLNVYPGESGKYTLYLDDGLSRSSAISRRSTEGELLGDEKANNEYREVRITHKYTNKTKKTREIKIERVHDTYTPKHETFFYVGVLHEPKDIQGSAIPIAAIHLDGEALHCWQDAVPEKAAKMLEESGINSWYYHPGLRIAFIKVFDDKAKRTLQLNLR